MDVFEFFVAYECNNEVVCRAFLISVFCVCVSVCVCVCMCMCMCVCAYSLSKGQKRDVCTIGDSPQML